MIAYAQGDWRAPNDEETITEARANILSWKGKLVGFSGNIVKITEGYVGKPIIVLEIGNEELVVGSNITGNFQTGDEIVLLGILTHIRENDTKTKALTEDKFFVLGICAINKTQEWGAGMQDQEELCREWFFDRFPETPR